MNNESRNPKNSDGMLEKVLQIRISGSPKAACAVILRREALKSATLFLIANALILLVSGITRYGGSSNPYLLEPLFNISLKQPVGTSLVISAWCLCLLTIFVMACRIRLRFRQVPLPWGFSLTSLAVSSLAVVLAILYVGIANLPSFSFMFIVTTTFSSIVGAAYGGGIFGGR